MPPIRINGVRGQDLIGNVVDVVLYGAEGAIAGFQLVNSDDAGVRAGRFGNHLMPPVTRLFIKAALHRQVPDLDAKLLRPSAR